MADFNFTTSSGGFVLSGTAGQDGPFDLTWVGNAGEGDEFSHWYRVVSKPSPRNFIIGQSQGRSHFPVKDLTEEEDENARSRVIIHVLARNLQELCQKLKNNHHGFIFGTESVARFDPRATGLDSEPLPDDEFQAGVTLTDITEEFLDTVECFDFNIDEDRELDGNELEMEDASAGTASGGLVIGGGITAVSGTSFAASFYDYPASGGLTIGGTSLGSASFHSFTASGGLFISGSSGVSQDVELVIVGGPIVIGGHSIAITLGSEDIEMETGLGDVAEFMGHFPIEIAPAITTTGDRIDTACCPSDRTPIVVILEHFNLDRIGRLSAFLRRNGLALPDATTLTYTDQIATWHGNILLQGTALNSNDPEQWNIAFEFSCIDPPFGARDIGTIERGWKFAISFFVTNQTTSERRDTRLILLFNTSDVCPSGLFRSFNFSLNTATLQASPATFLPVVLSDRASVFTSKFLADNPTLNFLIRLVESNISKDRIYPEIFIPMRTPVRGASPDARRDRIVPFGAPLETDEEEEATPPVVIGDGPLVTVTEP